MCARMQQQLQMPAIRSARRDHWSAGVLVWLVGWLSKVCVRLCVWLQQQPLKPTIRSACRDHWSAGGLVCLVG